MISTERILVTGASGFTGSHLCERLVDEGHKVAAMVRNPQGAAHLYKLGVNIIHGDLVNFENCLKATENVDTVYHIAALFRHQGVPKRAFWDVNATGSENILKASVHHGVRRFIHCSTVGVHGHIEHPPANEDAPYSPGDPYQQSKMEGEEVAIRYMRQNHMAVTIVRPTGIYGPGDLRFLKLFSAIQKGRFWMIGTGGVFYHLTYIDDLIDGILLCGKKPEAAGRIYILAGKEYVTLNDFTSLITEILGVQPYPKRRIPIWPVYTLGYLCELICQPFGIEPPLHRRRVDFFRKSRAFEINKATNELGFYPKVDLRTGLERTANWYRDNGYI